MTNCCTTDESANAQPCPHCGAIGPIVGPAPVRPHRVEAVDGDWQHCATAGCPVVYFLLDDVVTANDARTQVAHKAVDKPEPVCFCFSHTRDDLAADLEANDGISTIKATVKTAAAEGFCACEHLNPSGSCCLADIHRALNTIAAEATDPA